MENSNQQGSELINVEIPLSMEAIKLMKIYSIASGTPHDQVAAELSGEVSDIFVTRLKEMVAKEMGLIQPRIDIRTPQSRQNLVEHLATTTNERIADLGDDDVQEEAEELPPSSDEDVLMVGGGLTDEQLEQDMSVDDPEKEAKGAPLDMDGMDGEDIFNQVIAETPVTQDTRARRRIKNFTGAKGKVKPLTPGVEAEGSGEAGGKAL